MKQIHDKKGQAVTECLFESISTQNFEQQYGNAWSEVMKSALSALLEVSQKDEFLSPERVAQAVVEQWSKKYPTIGLPEQWRAYLCGLSHGAYGSTVHDSNGTQLDQGRANRSSSLEFKASTSDDFEILPATNSEHLHLLEPKAHILLLQEQLAQCQEKLDMVRLRLELDPLTNVLNRKGLIRAFKKEASKNARKKAHVHMLFLEPFEKDRLIHLHSMQFLEALLVHISSKLMHLVRPEDHVGYLQERGVFAIILCDTPASQVQVVVQRVLTQVPKGSCMFRYHHIPVNISVSGVSAHQGIGFDNLCEKGVQLLQECSKLGMNKAHLDLDGLG